MKTFETLSDFVSHVGQEVAVTNWRQITQEHIQMFADATGDHQWIHIDPERAKSGPFGGTIAHGFLTLSMIAAFTLDAFEIGDVNNVINYGLNKVRFPAPVPSGSKVRARITLDSAEEVKGGQQVVLNYTIDCEGVERPVCVAEWVVRYYN